MGKGPTLVNHIVRCNLRSVWIKRHQENSLYIQEIYNSLSTFAMPAPSPSSIYYSPRAPASSTRHRELFLFLRYSRIHGKKPQYGYLSTPPSNYKLRLLRLLCKTKKKGEKFSRGECTHVPSQSHCLHTFFLMGNFNRHFRTTSSFHFPKILRQNPLSRKFCMRHISRSFSSH